MSTLIAVPENEVALVALARQVGHALQAHGLMAATAESCTGGLVGHLLTEIAGSSAWFAGSAGTYSYAAKERVLGVDHGLLMREGAVSAAVAAQMAQGARRLYATDVAISVTGIAGPGGGSLEKPVGLVYFHLSAADGTERGDCVVWSADRRGNKLLSAERALSLLLAYTQDRSLK